MIRFIYNLLWPVGLLVFLPGYFVKMIRRGGYRKKFGQRLGIYSPKVRARLSTQPSTWLHAVSVGEVNIALKLARALRAQELDLHCVLTTTTTTGFALANQNAPSWIEVMYTPIDYWPVMRRAFSVVRPSRIILVEAEVWPNFAAEAHSHGIPLALVNARLSPRSEARYRKFRFFVTPTFRLLDLVCVQQPEDVARWATLGVDRSRIHCTGSIKYDPDVQMECEPMAPSISANRPVLFGGSTHRGEEEILGQVFLQLRQQFPSLLLFIAPRHVERLREVRAELTRLGLRLALASQMLSDRCDNADCVLLDTTGELQRWYDIATVVFVGKSLTAHGGQNPVEPVLAGKPIIVGPNMENFGTLTKALVEKEAAIQVCDADSLGRAIAQLLSDNQTRERLVQNAREVLSGHKGATGRVAQFVHNLRKS